MFSFYDKNGKPLTLGQTGKKILIRIVNILLDFELLILSWVGHIPSHLIRRYVYRFCGLTMGKGSTIHMWSRFYDPWRIVIGDDTLVGDHAFLDGRGHISIGHHVAIASSVMLFSAQHDVHSDDFHAVSKPIVIEDYVFLGPRVIILPGVTVGTGAVVAAGAVVTKDVAPFTLVAGVPAVFIGKRANTSPHYRLGRARLFQ